MDTRNGDVHTEDPVTTADGYPADAGNPDANGEQP